MARLLTRMARIWTRMTRWLAYYTHSLSRRGKNARVSLLSLIFASSWETSASREVFSLWDTNREEINNFIEHANNYHPTIKFTADISDEEIIFLDTLIR